MIHPGPLQISSFFNVLPRWIAPATITVGFALLLFGMTKSYIHGSVGNRRYYNDRFATLSALSFLVSVSCAVAVTVFRHDLLLQFVFFVFVAGRILQGAVTARIIGTVSDFVLGTLSGRPLGREGGLLEFLIDRVKSRIIILTATTLILGYTIASTAGVFLIGNGDPAEAIERFWFGLFFLALIGLTFDFRHVSHRVSWTAAIGLILAVTGSFFYSPVGFSAFATVLGPYLTDPIPDWLRWPLGTAGFLFGVLLWVVLFLKLEEGPATQGADGPEEAETVEDGGASRSR